MCCKTSVTWPILGMESWIGSFTKWMNHVTQKWGINCCLFIHLFIASLNHWLNVCQRDTLFPIFLFQTVREKPLLALAIKKKKTFFCTGYWLNIICIIALHTSCSKISNTVEKTLSVSFTGRRLKIQTGEMSAVCFGQQKASLKVHFSNRDVCSAGPGSLKIPSQSNSCSQANASTIIRPTQTSSQGAFIPRP